MVEEGQEEKSPEEADLEVLLAELQESQEGERKPLSDIDKLKLLRSAQTNASTALEEGEKGAAARFARTENALALFERKHPQAVGELAKQTAEAALRRREAAVRRPPQPPGGSVK